MVSLGFGLAALGLAVNGDGKATAYLAQLGFAHQRLRTQERHGLRSGRTPQLINKSLQAINMILIIPSPSFFLHNHTNPNSLTQIAEICVFPLKGAVSYETDVIHHFAVRLCLGSLSW